jgi:hypothetical protein
MVLALLVGALSPLALCAEAGLPAPSAGNVDLILALKYESTATRPSF